MITSLTVSRMRTACLVRVCLGCYARGALSEGSPSKTEQALSLRATEESQ